VVEAFLLDFEGELYGEQVALEFVEYLRPQQTFPDADVLTDQMAADCERVRRILAGSSRPEV
jgi:riboflavin kinase/FMN adenylyltransferase